MFSILIFVLTFQPGYCQDDGELSEKVMNGFIKKVLSDYDKTQRAQIESPLWVTVNFHVHGLSAVNEKNMDYEVSSFIRQVVIYIFI